MKMAVLFNRRILAIEFIVMIYVLTTTYQVRAASGNIGGKIIDGDDLVSSTPFIGRGFSVSFGSDKRNIEEQFETCKSSVDKIKSYHLYYKQPSSLEKMGVIPAAYYGSEFAKREGNKWAQDQIERAKTKAQQEMSLPLYQKRHDRQLGELKEDINEVRVITKNSQLVGRNFELRRLGYVLNKVDMLYSFLFRYGSLSEKAAGELQERLSKYASFFEKVQDGYFKISRKQLSMNLEKRLSLNILPMTEDEYANKIGEKLPRSSLLKSLSEDLAKVEAEVSAIENNLGLSKQQAEKMNEKYLRAGNIANRGLRVGANAGAGMALLNELPKPLWHLRLDVLSKFVSLGDDSDSAQKLSYESIVSSDSAQKSIYRSSSDICKSIKQNKLYKYVLERRLSYLYNWAEKEISKDLSVKGNRRQTRTKS